MTTHPRGSQLSELYLHHRRRAFALANRILGDRADAEDVVQDVFYRLFVHGSAFRGEAAYSTWLHRVVVNSSLNSLRARRRRGRLTHAPAERASPEELAIARELDARFLEALEQLPAPFRQVVFLREVRGFSYPDICAMLRMPVGTVKSALHRGRARLGALLRPHLESAR